MIKRSQLNNCLVSILCGTALLGCVSSSENTEQKQNINKSSSLFITTEGVIPFDKTLSRKWGAAVVADVDQNGWEDILTTQHGTNVLIYWN